MPLIPEDLLVADDQDLQDLTAEKVQLEAEINALIDRVQQQRVNTPGMGAPLVQEARTAIQPLRNEINRIRGVLG